MKLKICVALLLSISCLVIAASPVVAHRVANTVIEEQIRRLPLAAPAHRVGVNQVYYQGSSLAITIPDLVVLRLQGSSMLPMAGDGALILVTTDFSIADIQIGDFIVVDCPIGQYFHQVIEVGADDQGWFCQTSGLNVTESFDWEKVRPNEVRHLALGILW